MEFLNNVDWLVIAGGVVTSAAAIWGLVKLWVKITPNKTDDVAIENAAKYIDPILKGAGDLVRPQDKQAAEPRKSLTHDRRVVKGEQPK